MEPPLLRPSCLACAQIELDSGQCDGQLPCRRCAQHQSHCAYPQPPPFPSQWTADLKDVESWPEPVYLRQGTIGAARLATALTKEGKVKRFDWEPAVGQQQDLRIRPSLAEQIHHVFPPTISGDHELEPTEQLGDRINFASDVELLNNFTHLAPYDLIPPTILLNAALAARPPRTSHRITTAFEPWNLNVGNNLSSVGLPASDKASSCTFVAWRRGDDSYRGTAVGWGTLIAQDDPETLPDAFSSAQAHPSALIDPLSTPIARTMSPILQLSLAALPLSSPTALLAIRTQTELKLLQLGADSSPPTTFASFDYSGADSGRRPMGDVALGGVTARFGEPGGGLVADVDGGLWGWGLGTRGSGRIGDPDWRGQQPEMFRLRRGKKAGNSNYSGFVRVAYGGARGSDAIVALEDEVLQYDLRSSKASSSLVDTDLLSRHIPFGQVGTSVVTSLLQRSPHSTSSPDGLHVVSTTRDILWIDERMPGKELLRWAHDRVGKEGKGADRTLSLLEVPTVDHRGEAETPHRVALHSRLHPMVTLFTYSSSATRPPRSLLDPYSLPSPTPSAEYPFVRAGLSLVPLESMRDGSGASAGRWLVAEVGNDGAVYQRTCSTATDDEADTLPAHVVTTTWSEQIAEMGRVFAARQHEGRSGSSVGGKESAETKLMHMSKLNAALTERIAPQVVNGAGKGLAERVARATEMMQAAREEPTDGIDSGALTAQELLYFAEEPEQIKTRQVSSDLDDDIPLPHLPSLPRPSTFDRRFFPSLESTSLGSAIPQLHKLADSTSAWAGWTSSAFEPRPNHAQSTRFCQTIAPDLSAAFDTIGSQATTLRRRYAVEVDSDEEDVDDQRRRLSTACDELVLELSLSSRVSHPRPLSPNPPPEVVNCPHPPDRSPPALHFAHFRPHPHVKGRSRDEYSSADDDDDVAGSNWKKPSLKSAGVRALLSEWHLGSDPRSYTWSNPYADEQNKEDPFSQSQLKKEGKQRKHKREKLSVAPSSFALSSSQLSSSAAFPSSFPSHFSFAPAPPAAHPQAPASSQQLRRIPTIIEEGRSSSPGPSFPASQPQPFRSAAGESQPLRVPAAFGGALSQPLPGAFGAREKKEREKKKAKKRVSGF